MSFPEKIYYEPKALDYELGAYLSQKYAASDWIAIESHNNIPELRARPNSDFAAMKRFLIIGIRKTHKYVENHKVSDYLVPYTSSGCTAACLYCYLVCNYNKCSYLRLFVNREQMLDRLMKVARESSRELTFEIGSNSDLVFENTITGNLAWTIERFAAGQRGFITLPTKFSMVEPLLQLNHAGRVIFRMSVNPEEIISRVEIGTSPLHKRIDAVNKMCEAGYRVGLLVAPVILCEGWEEKYARLIEKLEAGLSPAVKKNGFLEIIFMTYSFVHRAINADAFPEADPLYCPALMTGRGRGKYCYNIKAREMGEAFLTERLSRALPNMPIIYIA